MTREEDVLLLTPSEQLRFNRLGARLRIIAGTSGLAFAAVTAGTTGYPEFPYGETLTLSAFVLLYNLFGMAALRNAARREDVRHAVQPVQHVLTLLDQLTLTAALYVFGGLELFVLPIIVLAMFMVAINNAKRESYFFFVTSLALVGAFFLLQHVGFIPYKPALPSWVGLNLPEQNPITSTWFALTSTLFILGLLLFAVLYFSNFIKDKFGRVLTEYMSGKKEITSLRQLSASILDIFPFALIIIDPESGTVEAANPAAASLLGAHPGWLGRSVGRIADLEEAGLAPYIERALAGETFRLTSFPLVRPDLEKRYLSINVFSGDLSGVASNKILFCAEDITERLQRETEQHEMQQALLQTEKLASLGQMAAGIAHELNNPLSAIDAYSQFLSHRVRSGGTIGEESIERIDRIAKNADRIRLLVRNLLSYARPSPETAVELSLTRVVNESMKLVEHEIRKNNIVVELDLDDTLPRVSGNKTQLQQVLINLVTNAIFACEPKTGRIRITTTAYGDSSAELIVEDNGAGIERGSLDKIFEPFFSTKPVGEGTGLGLAIVMAIVEKHNGSIQVASEPEKGTKFMVRVPFAGVGTKDADASGAVPL